MGDINDSQTESVIAHAHQADNQLFDKRYPADESMVQTGMSRWEQMLDKHKS